MEQLKSLSQNYLQPTLNMLNGHLEHFKLNYLFKYFPQLENVRITKTQLAGITVITIAFYYCG
jgi:hypothetical protein